MLETLVGGNTCISCCTYKRLAAFHFDVFAGLDVFVPFRQAKVNHIDNFGFLSLANHKIVGFDVTMDESFAVDLF